MHWRVIAVPPGGVRPLGPINPPGPSTGAGGAIRSARIPDGDSRRRADLSRPSGGGDHCRSAGPADRARHRPNSRRGRRHGPSGWSRNSSVGALPLSPVTIARWPEGSTVAGTRLDPSLIRITRDERSPTPAIRLTTSQTVHHRRTIGHPASAAPTLTMTERRNGEPASAITSAVTKLVRGVEPHVIERDGIAFFELQGRPAPALHPLPYPRQFPRSGHRPGYRRGNRRSDARPRQRASASVETRHEPVDQADPQLLHAALSMRQTGRSRAIAPRTRRAAPAEAAQIVLVGRSGTPRFLRLSPCQ